MDSHYYYDIYNRICNKILARDWFSFCHVIGVQSRGCPITGMQFQ